MAPRKLEKFRKTKLKAEVVSGARLPCVFCQRKVDDEVTYGKLYAIGDIQCHYFCVLLSCCLLQKGKDEEGLFGFLYDDILAEVERSKKHKCSYCLKDGATLGCSVIQCRKQFHLPCGRERNAVSLFYGNYKTFCQQHAPKQKIPSSIMEKAKLRKAEHNKRKRTLVDIPAREVEENGENSIENESVCVICYEAVEGYPTHDTFWPPCCARDAWFHRSCLQRMTLSAGIHYLKCPLCNDKENFYQAVMSQGYYVPDRDAAWELEQNAFAEIYERPLYCSVDDCKCPMGRKHNSDNGMWEIKLCLLCGSTGGHASCLETGGADPSRLVCNACGVVAPSDLEQLYTAINEVVLGEENASSANVRSGPIMPSRMSLRRTKQRIAAQNVASSSTSQNVVKTEIECQDSNPKDLTTSRQELNLKTPRKPQTNPETNIVRDVEMRLLSPVKLLEQTFKEKVSRMDVKDNIELDERIVEELRRKFKKPKPLSEKKRIVNELLDGLFDSFMKENKKQKEPVKEWCSPKKCLEVKEEMLKVQDETIKVMPELDTDQAFPSPKSNTDKEPFGTLKSPDKTSLKTVNPDIIDEMTQDVIANVNDSSNSSFELPAEFIADRVSDDSLSICETPKKLKTVNMQKDSSLEISEHDEVINIDVFKMEASSNNSDFIKSLNLKSPVKTKMCAFKFSPTDKEVLQSDKVDIDLESFKNQYLNEVDREFQCHFNHNHKEHTNSYKSKLRTAIDFAKEAADAISQTNPKRERKPTDVVPKKKKRVLEDKGIVLSYTRDGSTDKAKKSKRKSKKNVKTKLSIRDKDIKVKIKFKKERLKVKICEKKMQRSRKRKEKGKSLKQYVLQYAASTSKEFITKPQHAVDNLKRKYVKQNRSPDNLKQMSIQDFFKRNI